MSGAGQSDRAGAHIALAHGNGGRRMRQLIEELFARHLANAQLDVQADAAALPSLPEGTIMVTTDGFTVDPLEFPGGDIGSLAVHGTVNDLAVCGADPLYLTLNCFLEEGLEIARLDRIIASMAGAAAAAGVRIVAGDTKVVRRGEGSGLYLATSGIGVRDRAVALGIERIRPGDRILVSGPIGDHGAAVLLARGQFGLEGDLASDATSVLPLARCLRTLCGVRFMRDPTRGGLATVAHEIARHRGYSIRLIEPRIPIRDPVRGVCEVLGYDPLYLACEGRIVVVVDPSTAGRALEAMHATGATAAADIGEIGTDGAVVVVQTELGGERLLEELDADPLPRIC